MTTPMPLTVPRVLRVAVASALVSMLASLGQGLMLLVTVSLFDGNESWRNEADDFGSVVIVGMIVSTFVAVVLAVSAILAMVLSSQAGRIMLFFSTSLAILWNLGCSCVLSAAMLSGSDSSSNDGSQHYLSWQFTTAVMLGFFAGIVAIATVILLAQRSVTMYYRELRAPQY